MDLEAGFETRIVGIRYYNARAEYGSPVALVREPDNPHDPNAVAVVNSDNKKVGYVPRDHAVLLSQVMDAGAVLYAYIDERELINDNAQYCTMMTIIADPVTDREH